MYYLCIYLLVAFTQQCSYQCDMCAENENCQSCNPTRLLQNDQCQCSDYYVEVGGNECLQCSQNCVKCEQFDPSSCIFCGDQTVTHRVLNSMNQCECENNYQEMWFTYNCFSTCYLFYLDIQFSSQIYSFQYILKQPYYVERLQQKYVYTQSTLAGIQKMVSSGIIFDTSLKYQHISNVRQSTLQNLVSPYPAGEYYAELHENIFTMAINLESGIELTWAANVNSTTYQIYPSTRILYYKWNIKIIQFKLPDFDGHIFLQVAISQNKDVSSGRRLLSGGQKNMTLLYYLGYQKSNYLLAAELEDIINDIMYIIIQKPDNSIEYVYDGIDIIINSCTTNYELLTNNCGCKEGYFPYKNECYKECPLLCQTCTKEVCVLFDHTLICRDGYYLDTQLQICLPCSHSCATCENNIKCLSCNQQLIFVDGQCLTCQEYRVNDAFCEQYDDNCDCTNCLLGYQLKISDCIKCPIPCSSCYYEDICISCFDGYYLENSECKSCQQNCTFCNSLANCIKCSPGYYINQGIVNVCSNFCHPFRINCECGGCLPQQYLSKSDSLCYNCVSPCLTCSSDQQCLTCVSDFYYYDQINYDCPICVSPCRTCESAILCKTCINDEFFINDQKQCEKCQSPIKSCLIKGECLTCIEGSYCHQYLCHDCPTYCKFGCFYDEILNYIQCKDCESGYFKSQLDIPFQCNQCSDGCLSCDDQENCTICVQGYQLFDTKCVKCSTIYSEHCIDCKNTECIQCESPYKIKERDCFKDIPIQIPDCQKQQHSFYNPLQNSCDPCMNQCLTCANAQSCTSCPEEFHLDKGVCPQCLFPCKLCLSNTYCLSTNDGYFIDSEISDLAKINAFMCLAPCKTCKSLTQCIICIDGYYFNEEQCIQCDNNCKSCVKESTTCKSCPEGYQLIETKCSQCIDIKCQQCNSYCSSCNHLLDDQYICFECQPGYLKINQDCIRCDVSCKTCVQTITQCSSCYEKYYLTKQLTCLPCETGCIQCQIETKSCLQCDTGLQLIEITELNQQCIKCSSGCQKCNVEMCLECLSQDYYLTEDGKCINCVIPCKTCQSQTLCLSCVDGYYQYGEVCLACSDGCQQCLNNSTCLKCKSGFYSEEQLCRKCPLGCTTCISSNECLTCESNYYRDELCHVCQDPCQTCTKEKCTSCDTNFELTPEGQCSIKTIQCIPNCQECKNSTQCIKCDETYLLSQDALQCSLNSNNIETVIAENEPANSSSGLLYAAIGGGVALIPIGILLKRTYDQCKLNIKPRRPDRSEKELKDLIETEPSLPAA